MSKSVRLGLDWKDPECGGAGKKLWGSGVSLRRKKNEWESRDLPSEDLYFQETGMIRIYVLGYTYPKFQEQIGAKQRIRKELRKPRHVGHCTWTRVFRANSNE